MNYNFPIITNIQQVRDAIAGRDEFIEADRGDHIIFNYLVNFEDTFPPVWNEWNFPLDGPKMVFDENAAIRRECRGLIFDKSTGKVIARRYHKFFNAGEREETQWHNLDFSKPHRFLEKLDGSMITPFRTSTQGSDEFYVGTKMGITDVAANAKAFIDNDKEYIFFINWMLSMDMTPIFEWCSVKNRIVVEYPTDRLVLTAIRDNVSGRYVNHNSMNGWAEEAGVETILEFDVTLDEARDSLSTITDEGYVVRFNDGHMIKMKGAHYLILHKTMEKLTTEKDVIELIVSEKIDDAKAFLPSSLAEKLDEFAEDILLAMRDNAYKIAVECLRDYSADRKEYAMIIKEKEYHDVRFRLYDFMDKKLMESQLSVSMFEEECFNIIKQKVLNSLSSSSKVENIRSLIGGYKWEF